MGAWNFVGLSFLSGFAIGAALGALRLKARLRLYEHFIHARLEARTLQFVPPTVQLRTVR